LSIQAKKNLEAILKIQLAQRNELINRLTEYVIFIYLSALTFKFMTVHQDLRKVECSPLQLPRPLVVG